MSTVTLIAALIVLLVTLVAYALVHQTLQQKRERKKRLLAALKTRAGSFKLILNSCPEGFLPRGLCILVQRSLTEILEQLSKLEPKEKSYAQEQEKLNALITAAESQTAPDQRVSLQNLAQIKEVRGNLEELHRFIVQQETRKVLEKSQAEAYRKQIKQLTLQITVDGYTLNGLSAKQAGKIKLALHHYDHALNLLIRGQHEGENRASIDRLRAISEALQAQLKEQESAEEGNVSPEEQTSAREWSKFDDPQETWKKKNVYD